MVIALCLCERLGRPILLFLLRVCEIYVCDTSCILSPITFENLISRILVSVDFERLMTMLVFLHILFRSKSPTFGWISYIPDNTFLHIPSRQIHFLSDAVSLFRSDTRYSFYVAFVCLYFWHS